MKLQIVRCASHYLFLSLCVCVYESERYRELSGKIEIHHENREADAQHYSIQITLLLSKFWLCVISFNCIVSNK